MGELEKILSYLKQRESDSTVLAAGRMRKGLIVIDCVLTVMNAADGTQYYNKWFVEGERVTSVQVMVVPRPGTVSA